MKKKEKTVYNEDGTIKSITIKPHLIDKYYHRIKMKIKKNHKSYCQCYWCLKKRFTSDITCPKCNKRKLKLAGFHINRGFSNHESGFNYYCKCGFNKRGI